MCTAVTCTAPGWLQGKALAALPVRRQPQQKALLNTALWQTTGFILSLLGLIGLD